jgi:hypothetical protein
MNEPSLLLLMLCAMSIVVVVVGVEDALPARQPARDFASKKSRALLAFDHTSPSLSLTMQSNQSPSGAPPPKRRRPASKKPQLQAPTAASSATTTALNTPSVTPRPSTPAEPATESSRGFTNVRFTDFLARGQISQPTATGIASLRPVHEFCTEVQAATLPVILTGVDV